MYSYTLATIFPQLAKEREPFRFTRREDGIDDKFCLPDTKVSFYNTGKNGNEVDLRWDEYGNPYINDGYIFW